MAALGKKKDVSIINENAQWDNQEYASNYAISKYFSELEVWRGQMEGLQTVIINPSFVLGPGDLEKSSTRIFKYVYGENKYYTDGTLNYVDVRDVAEVIFLLISKKVAGERFILNAGTTTYKQLFDEIAFYFSKQAPWTNVKGKLLKFAFYADQIKSLITRKDPVITQEIVQLSKNHYQYDSSKFQNEFNFQFKELDETLEWTCKNLALKLKKTR